MSLSLERLARNQVLFREVNERLAEIGEFWGDSLTGFLCECTRIECE